MSKPEIIINYIQKLRHPIKEIRERSLQSLKSKFKLGWEFDDEISGTRFLLESLMEWFNDEKPLLQREALDLLHSVIKTKSGTYIVQETGLNNLVTKIQKFKDKIDKDALNIYEDIMESLTFLNTVSSEENLNIPRLSLSEEMRAESCGRSSSSYYNLASSTQSSKESSVLNICLDVNGQSSNSDDGVKVLLFPWADLSQSDIRPILLIEDALRLLRSTRRCCRFIRDVFLRDFPAEIFLNRPQIIKNLWSMIDGNNKTHSEEALHVLFHITSALRSRLLQLKSFDLKYSIQFTGDDKISQNDVNLELEQITGDDFSGSLEEDKLIALKQLPAPIFTLESLHSIFSTMNRNLTFFEQNELSDILAWKELNTFLQLIEVLVGLLFDCVTEKFWSVDHTSKTHRDISHKSCMVMRVLGDILTKYRESFFNDTAAERYRVAWLRLIFCGERFLNWARNSALPPSSLVSAVQAAQLDPAVDLFYPELSNRISIVLQNVNLSVDQEYKSKYRELKMLFSSMEHAVNFMKNKNSCRNTTKVLTVITDALPTLELIQSETFLNDVINVLLIKTKDFVMDENDWSKARNIALKLMAHNSEWVRAKFYERMADMVKSILVDETNQSVNEKSLTLICDVGVLTEICCHGLSSKSKEVEEHATDVMLYLLRGRLVLSDGCWWRLMASLLPVLPLLHVYAAHETHLGRAICKSLERDIANCMGVSNADLISGLVRLLFVRCATVQLDAAHSLCRLLDDERYLPPQQSLRVDVLLSALRRVKTQEFNLDTSSSPTKMIQTTALLQMLDVLKQGIVLDERGAELVARPPLRPALEPSLRRTTLQQLALVMRQQQLHETFMEYDGLRVVVATLRMSLLVDDYLAFPECAVSCVSVLNSVCFTARHALAKIPDLFLLLLRVILVFPTNEAAVAMTAQVLALVAWAGFVLQELDSARRRVPALPLNVTDRISLPFNVHSYWSTSPNAEHSYIEWLLGEEQWRACIRVRWWCTYAGRACVLQGPSAAAACPAPLGLQPAARDVAALRTACPQYACGAALLALENATSHAQVNDALHRLESYIHLVSSSTTNMEEFSSLPWQNMQKFISAPPASSRDTILLTTLLHFIITYMDNLPNEGATLFWIKQAFIGNDASIITLLSREQFYPQQTTQECIEVTQLHIHIVKVLLRCVILLERDEYSTNKLESLLKILLACLERTELKNFHMLGYLNELTRCVRHALNSRYCKLSQETLIECMKLLTKTLNGCASGAGCKGQACRLDIMLSILALLREIFEEAIPVQRWSEAWSSDAVREVFVCGNSRRVELRAAAIHVVASLAHYAQFLPHLLQAIEEDSLSQYAARIFSHEGESNIVRVAAADLLTSITARASPKSNILENEVLEQLKENNILESVLDILVEFCNTKQYKQIIEPNISLSVLDRRSEIEVRANKCSDLWIRPSTAQCGRPPPSIELIAAVADLLHNVSAFAHCPLQEWNERGLYRLLFRCATSCSAGQRETGTMRGAACRALAAVTSHKCVRTTLASTKDCLHNLLMTLSPIQEEHVEGDCIFARSQGLLLLASLLKERTVIRSLWTEQRELLTSLLVLIQQALQSNETEFRDAALCCLAQLVQSIGREKHVDKTNDLSIVDFYDNVKSSLVNKTGSVGDGDGGPDDCVPEYMAEELCKILVNLYRKILLDNKKHLASQNEQWVNISSCLSSVLAVSPRSREFGVHRHLPKVLLEMLQAARDHLSVQGKPADVIRNANNNPVLCTLYWVLTSVDCLMVNCPAAKISFAEDNIALSLNKLWPWCMMTDQLRQAVMHLLYTFTNDCEKAYSSMCTCVSGRNLTSEVCALAAREAALQSRTRADSLLLLALNTLRNCLHHHHCRTIIIKSDVLSSVYRMCVRERVRGACGAADAWAGFVETLSRHADGAAAVLGALAPRAAMCALPPPLRAKLMPALAHGAHYHRVAFLQSSDLLELLSGSLLAGDVGDVVSAARAVWALAANNHKAKLLLRSAGIPAAVHSALQRLQRHQSDAASMRALQLLTYTNTVLQAT
ncbi:rotatin isoform X2 [Bombyx mori]|uniref:Rotatin N-terminal domain-containing protein n=1 Tax=Bombyx mori TaxID=7091 RepID=A0A8R2GA46_BOMMO|nr:rotatin isoform X2 [Bombyx mori]